MLGTPAKKNGPVMARFFLNTMCVARARALAIDTMRQNPSK
jgi:hypothetical protein